MQGFPFELVAAGLGVVSVFFAIRRHIVAFPIGIGMAAINAFLFFHKAFYAQAGLQLVFIALQIWGWTQWNKARQNDRKAIVVHDSISGRAWLLSALALVAGSVGIGLLLREVAGGLPFLDATTTSLLLLAQFWLNRQQLRHWFIWKVAATLLFVQMAHGGLYWLMLLNLVLFVQSLVGFFVWRKEKDRN